MSVCTDIPPSLRHVCICICAYMQTILSLLYGLYRPSLSFFWLLASSNPRVQLCSFFSFPLPFFFNFSHQVLESPALDNEINTIICMFGSYLRTRAPDTVEKDDSFQDLFVAISDGRGTTSETLKEKSAVISTGAQEISETDPS